MSKISSEEDSVPPAKVSKGEEKCMKVETKKPLSSIHKRYFKSVEKKCHSWISATSPFEPSFCFFYLREGKEIIWTGPQHMSTFAQSHQVLELFREAALSRNIIQSSGESMKACSPLTKNPIQLKFKNPRNYTNDVLAKIIPRILNPSGRRNFYEQQNKPQWFPTDVVFRRPNHPKEGEKRMTAEEMSKVLKAFMINCPHSYKIIKNEDETEESEEEEEEEDQTEVERKEEGMNMDIKLVDTPTEQRAFTSEEALQWCSRATTFADFIERTQQAIKSIDISPISSAVPVTAETINSRMIDWRRKHLLKDKLPAGMTPALTSSLGDCLFGAISVCLFGNLDHEKLLRLAAIAHGIVHYEHYIDMFSEKIENMSDAVQFLATVSSDESVLNKCRFNTLKQVIEYTITSEVQATAKLGAYSGLVQVLLLAGATEYAIQQHSEEERDGYNSLIQPCSCLPSAKATINIMWVKSSGGSALMNHIIPLLPDSDHAQSALNSRQDLFDDIVSYSEVCLFCARVKRVNKGKEDMIMCDQCHTWYHCSCVGIARALYDDESTPFHCCLPPPDHLNFVVVKAQKEKRTVQVKVSDVQSLYPRRGISDAIIDFYVRIMSPSSLARFTAGALAYTALAQTSSDVKRKFANTNGAIDITNPLLLFPCRPKDIWHWILVAVYPSKQLALVLDSNSKDELQPYAAETVRNISRLLQCWPKLGESELRPVPFPVPQQKNGYDCGLHVLHNIVTVARNTDALLKDAINRDLFVCNPSSLRKAILRELEIRSQKTSSSAMK